MSTLVSRTTGLALAAGLGFAVWEVGASAVVPNFGHVVATPAHASEAGTDRPHKILKLAGTSDRLIKLSPKAAKRLDIQTSEIGLDAAGKKFAPYDAVFFDIMGESWVYINPSPLGYLKRKVTIQTVEGNAAYLVDGPPEGTKVVTVGVAELNGAELGIGH